LAVVTGVNVVRLSDLAHGQEAECFGALSKKEPGTDKNGNPFVRCYFRDKRVVRVAPLWFANPIREVSEGWPVGEAYRLKVRGDQTARYGFQLEIIAGRPVIEDDKADGYDFFDLVESTDYSPDLLFETIHGYIDRYIQEECLATLVRRILDENEVSFKRMPAAQAFHHSFTGGLLEHVWSMTRVSGFLAEHYGKYYSKLDPPLNRGVIVAAAILHDIGKLRELVYHPVEVKYSTVGSLVGHVLLGRDLVREVARTIAGFPDETLLLLEHAILAHHGKEEFGAPKAPQTIEALIVHYADDIDSKINAAARERLRSTTDEQFTDKVFALGRRIYKGIPQEPAVDDPKDLTA